MAKAVIPVAVQIGPYLYTVERNQTAALQAKVENRSASCVGSNDPGAQVIRIDPEQGPDSTVDTLLHEVLHAVWSLVGLHEGTASKYEEQVIAALSPSLLDTLRRNPDFVRCLTTTQ